MGQVSRIMFAVAAALLLVLAAALIGYAGYQLVKAMASASQVLAAGDFGYIVIDSVGYVVIAIAILDVTKHIFAEEVRGWRDRSREHLFRESFHKFVSIISIAIFLEGLVLVFKVSQDEVRLLLYPVLLLFVAVAMMVGLAVSQRLGVAPDRDADSPN
ncbi:hypothetical protein [Arvimicrobium flavum]|uniref:hypothetical protein n=1 Tax=Arvimicrobium flavum TaxID=3393320 RepID=UPI00237A59E8|nr:hypothetical protein [Mesorhizobium shangrilense]